MATTLTAIREALAANLATITTGFQPSPYLLSNPSPPAMHLYPAEIEYDLAMRRGLDKWTITVQAFVGLTSDIGAQVVLDAFIAASGATSVKEALESDQTLGGAASVVNVTTCSGYQVYARGAGSPVLGAEWTVEILATGE